jgi:hypothetical protein
LLVTPTVASYRAGRLYAVVKGWLIIDVSRTRFPVTPEGEDA